MKNPTPRQKAEALVALIRSDYPLPSRNVSDEVMNPRDGSKSWYCVGAAYYFFIHQHPEMRPPKLGPYDWPPGNDYIHLNNAGRFEEAWKALTDAVAEAYSETA